MSIVFERINLATKEITRRSGIPFSISPSVMVERKMTYEDVADRLEKFIGSIPDVPEQLSFDFGPDFRG